MLQFAVDTILIPHFLARYVVFETTSANDLKLVLLGESFRGAGMSKVVAAIISRVTGSKRSSLSGIIDRLFSLKCWPLLAPENRFEAWNDPPSSVYIDNARAVKFDPTDEWKMRCVGAKVAIPVAALQVLESRFSVALYLRGMAALTHDETGEKLDSGVIDLLPSQLALIGGDVSSLRIPHVVEYIKKAKDDINALRFGLRVADVKVDTDRNRGEGRRVRVLGVRIAFKRIHSESTADTEARMAAIAVGERQRAEVAARPAVQRSSIPGRPAARPVGKPALTIVPPDSAPEKSNPADNIVDLPFAISVCESLLEETKPSDPDEAILSRFPVVETLTLETYRPSVPDISRSYDVLLALPELDQWRLARRIAEREFPVIGCEPLPDMTADPISVARITTDQMSRAVFNQRAHTRAFDILAAIGATPAIQGAENDDFDDSDLDD